MTAYEVLLEEIATIEAARDALPSDTHIRTLCDLTVRRLREHTETIGAPRNRVRVIAFPVIAVVSLGSAGTIVPLAS